MGRAYDINHLPNELLLHIFSYLSMKDLTNIVQHVCKKWKQLCYNDLRWETWKFSPEDVRLVEVVNFIKQAPMLKHIMLNKVNFVFEVVNLLCVFCPQLKTLAFKLNDYIICSHPLHLALSINNGNKLKYLNLTCCWGYQSTCVDFLAPFLKKCNSFESLEMNCCHTWDLDQLSCFLENSHDRLTSLRAFLDEDATKTKKNLFKLCTKLDSLTLLFSNKETNLENLGQLPPLKSFYLGFVKVFSDSLARLFVNNSWSSLQSLTLLMLRHLNNETLSCVFGQCSGLRQLNVSGSTINNVGIRTVFDCCPHLTTLNASDTLLTDQGFETIYKCSKLEFLSLQGCYMFTETVAKYIVLCKNLKLINLQESKWMTDEAVAKLLMGCRKLENLNIGFCHRICGTFLECTSFSLNLKILELSVGISEFYINQIKEKLPHIVIIKVHDFCDFN